MTIQTGDIKVLKSQVLLDTTDGGGAMTGSEVIDGQSNNLFPDISELDRTYGRITLRKAFAAVLTSTTDSYYGAHTIISRMPEDPRVSVSLFTTNDWFDRRTSARDKVERYLALGPLWPGHLLEKQLAGQRAIQLAMRPQDDEPKVGQGLGLVQNEGLGTEFSQFVRVTKVTSQDRTFVDHQNRDVLRKVVTVEISDPLLYTFTGPSVFQAVQGISGPAICRDTRVANAASYYGITSLTAPGAINDASIMVGDIFTQLVPSAQAETPLVDLTAAGLSSLYVPGNEGTINANVSASMGPTTKLYLGSSILPGTLTLKPGASTITDQGGTLMMGTTEIGSIDYEKGLCSFNANAPAYSGTIVTTFTPAGVPNRVQDTASISIVQDLRGYNYTITLIPSPMPGSLVVSYMAQGKVYYLYDRGDGVLKGSDAAFGSGSVNFTTGSVIVTLGALPDANSELIFAWGKKVDSFTRSSLTVAPARLEFQLANGQVAPGTVTVTWSVEGSPKSATDDGNGTFTGDATGKIHYASGLIKLVPSVLYQQGTEFKVNYQFGPPHEQTFPMPIRDGTGKVNVVLPNLGGNPIPKTVELLWNVDILDSETLGTIFTETIQEWNPIPPTFRVDPLVTAFDNGSGGFRRTDGTLQPNSSIDYSTRTISLAPEMNVRVPKPVWGTELVGSTTTSQLFGGGSLNTTVNTYRRIIESWAMVATIAVMPYDEKGYLTVKWRTGGSGAAVEETFTAQSLKFDLTPEFAESILKGSVRFELGGKEYVDRLGGLFHTIEPLTGAGTSAGVINYQSGVIEVDSWTPSAANAVTLRSLVTEMNIQPVDEVVFRIPVVPVRSGSLQVRCIPIAGNSGGQIAVTADATGRFNSPFMVGTVDYQTGVVRIRFGEKITVTPEVRTKDFFREGAVFTEGGIEKVIKPNPVYADSIRYNAVGYTYMPLAADILGLDPVRLPSDGRVPIFRQGDVAVVHHTEDLAFPTSPVPSIGTTLDVGRDRLSYIKVYDNDGVPVDPTMYNVDLDDGIVVLNSNYAQGSYVLPLRAEHRIEDMGLISDVQINGVLSLTRPLTHNFPVPGSFVSSALIFGDLQARAHSKFSQESWTSVWQDSPIGNPILAQYNEVQYPILVSNKGAAEEKWAMIFTSSSQFRVVGRGVGQIGTGDINTDTAPINPATGEPYWTLRALGWGLGWAAGNVLRFNTAGANYPIWLARTVLQGPVTNQYDNFQIQIRGDIDRV